MDVWDILIRLASPLIISGVVFLIVMFLYLYVAWEYKRVAERFYSGKWKGLQRKIRPLKRISNYLSGRKTDGPVRFIHDNYCVIWASISYCNGDEADFVRWLNDIKTNEPRHGKSFMLALYYRAKGEQEIAEQFYQGFIAGGQPLENQAEVMNYFFGNKELPEGKTIESICAALKNPADQKLVQLNLGSRVEIMVEDYEGERAKRLNVKRIIIIGVLCCAILFGGFFFLRSEDDHFPAYDVYQEKFDQNKENIEIVKDYLLALQSANVHIDEPNGLYLADDAGTFLIIDEKVRTAIEELWKEGIYAISKNEEENYISFKMHRANAKVYVGVAFLIDGNIPTEVDPAVSKEPLTEPGWVYYIVHYNQLSVTPTVDK